MGVNDRDGRKLAKAVKDQTRQQASDARKARRLERRRSPQVVDKAIDNTHSADVDMHERRIGEWSRPDEGPWTETPPLGELKHATEESLPPEEAALYE